MIITRTPYRISFFGGGTDYPAWYLRNGGAVVSASINKYCFITCRRLLPFFSHRYRIVYSRSENVSQPNEIQHPAVRAALQKVALPYGLEIHHDGEVPARAGLGSSSSFVVGLIKALRALEGHRLTAEEAARFAIDLEQNVIGDAVGSQDQIAAAYGGLNHIEFRTDGGFKVTPLALGQKREHELKRHLLLFYTGSQRPSYEAAKENVAGIRSHEAELRRIREMVDQSLEILKKGSEPIESLGGLMHESWKLKKSLAAGVSNSRIDEIYEAAMRAGAAGGKLLGAGGGGFMLFVATPAQQPRIRQMLSKLIEIEFDLESSGSQVIYPEE
jgi:D-glycero-alpha-D-manno-heptose-7-phosphate kinase